MKTRDLHRAEPRHDEMKSHNIQEEVHDPYKARKKPHAPLLCPKCGAVNLSGRWQWAKEKYEDLDEELCPACNRIHDNYPAGEVILSGSFLAKHKQEIIELARNTEQAERDEHPLQRIMSISEDGDKLVIPQPIFTCRSGSAMPLSMRIRATLIPITIGRGTLSALGGRVRIETIDYPLMAC